MTAVSTCVYCGSPAGEPHSRRCAVTKFGEKAIYDIDWREEAERLRNVAGKLQDDNDRLHHDLLELRELERLREAARKLMSAYMAGDDLAEPLNELTDAAGLRQQGYA